MVQATRLPITEHTRQPWRIHEIANDFRVLDVWTLPTPGGADDFPRLVKLMRSYDAERSSPVVHALFAARWALGRMFGLDGSNDGIGSRVAGLRERLPADLVDSSLDGVTTGPFTPLFVTGDEAALEIANRTVHGVLHLGWVPDGNGGYRGQMAVLVKPNGMLGAGYLSAIAPLRHLVVYPTMLRHIGQLWRTAARQVEVPQDVRHLSTLPRIDYADAFLVDTSAHPDWTPHQWAVETLEQASAATRAQLLAGWSALGLRSAATEDSVLGWDVRRCSDDAVLLRRDSWIGMPGELLFALRQDGLLFCTFIHHRTPATRAIWAPVQRPHVHIVRELLDRAARDARASAVAD